MKKWMSVITTLTLLLSMMAASFSASAEESEDFVYAVQGDTVTLQSFVGEEGPAGYVDVQIPEKIDGKTVTTLAATLFDDCMALIRIVYVPSTVTTIEDEALYSAGYIFCEAGSAAEAYAQEQGLTYCVDHVLYDPYDGSETPIPTKMEVSQLPEQTVYQDGSEFFELYGLELTFTFADNSTDTWTYTTEEEMWYQDVSIDAIPDWTTGEITISYLFCETSFEVEVLPNPVALVEAAKWPERGDYQGFELRITEKSGRIKKISGQDSEVLYYIDSMEGGMAALYVNDSDYGPVATMIMWGKEDGMNVCNIFYMEGLTMRMQPDYDVDGRNGTTVSDALLTLQAATQKVTLKPAQVRIADADGDGKVSAADALRILQAATGKLTTTQSISPDDFKNMMNGGDDWIELPEELAL